MKDVSKTFRSIIVTSHRGAAWLAPENTISSIKTALKYNADRIEIDVHQSLDGELIVMHDTTIDRTTNGFGQIKNLKYSELKKYSAGVNYSEKYVNEKIPTLNEVIKEVKGKAKLLIEVKYGNEVYPHIEANVIRTIEHNNAQKRCIIQSFNLDILKRINQLNPNIILHKLNFGKIPFFNIWISNKIEFENILKYEFIDEISIAYPFANKQIFNKIHNYSKKVNVWTVNNKKRIKKLVKLGVDGVITDYPNYYSDMIKSGNQ